MTEGKKASHLTGITDQQRAEMLAKAALAKEIKKANAINIVKLIDTPYHRELASLYGIRLPTANCQSNELKFVKRAARKLDVDINVWVKEVVGAKNLGEVALLNPNIGAAGMVGLLLEWAHEIKGGQHGTAEF